MASDASNNTTADMGWLGQLADGHEMAAGLLASAAVVAILLLLHWLVRRAIRRAHWPTPEARKRWIVLARNLTILLVIVALIMIWAKPLGDLTLALLGVALALVIATKELIMCVGGEVLRSSTRLFTVGSRIEIGAVRGDVIDLNLLTTTIMEVGPGRQAHQYTGRAVLVPNSMILSHPVYNESFTRHYVLHTFTVTARPDTWADAERCMIEAANEVCESYLDVARHHIEKIGDSEGLDTPSPEPRVALRMAEPDRIEMIVRVPAPVRQKHSIEQQIIRRYLELFEETGHLKRWAGHAS